MSQKTKIGLPPCGLLVGNAIYNTYAGYLMGSGYTYTSWAADSSTPLELIDLTVKENQGNIVQFWWFNGGSRPQTKARYLALEDVGITIPAPDFKNAKNMKLTDFDCFEKYGTERAGAGVLKSLKYAQECGLYTTMIYCEDVNPVYSKEFETLSPSYIGYDFGEKFTFRFDSQNAYGVEGITLKSLADDFVARVSAHIQERKEAGYGNICCTSSNFYMDYEVVAGVDFTMFEDCTCELNLATALSRGLCKQYELGIWGSHIANEYYAWIPWDNPCRFETLRAELYLKYLSGAKVIISESGAWHCQSAGAPEMKKTPRIVKPIGPTPDEQWLPFAEEAQKHFKNMDRDSEYCRNYRRIMSDFYDYVKANGTPEGQPEVSIAIAKGNYDLSSLSLDGYNMCHVIGGAQALADLNPRWFSGQPEKGWQIVSDVFWPRPAGIYGSDTYNRIFSGTPYGQIDIVSFAYDNITADFLSGNYKALIFAGWNTASEKQYGILLDYVKRGGILFISLPQFSKDITRNYTNYTVDDLVNGGDLSELCGVRVKGRGPRFYWGTVYDYANNDFAQTVKRHGYGVFYSQLGELEITDPELETLIIDQEAFKPLLLRRKLGKGQVFFLNSWYYPGIYGHDCEGEATTNSHGMFADIIRYIAKLARPQVFMTGKGLNEPDAECSFINLAAYPDQKLICLYNIDFEKPHTFDLHCGPEVKTITLAPREMRQIC